MQETIVGHTQCLHSQKLRPGVNLSLRVCKKPSIGFQLLAAKLLREFHHVLPEKCTVKTDRSHRRKHGSNVIQALGLEMKYKGSKALVIVEAFVEHRADRFSIFFIFA